MTDDPILDSMRMQADALEQADEGIIFPKNTAIVQGSVSKDKGAEIHGSLEHSIEKKKGTETIGVAGGVTQKQGGWVSGFFKWVWK